MTDSNPLPDAAFLRECLSYDLLTGVLTWRERPLHHFANASRQKAINSKFAGTPAGTLEPNGYIRLKLLNRKASAARVIWKMVTGEEPADCIDHRDTNRANNRWENLRPATALENAANAPRHFSNASGFKGIWPSANRNGKWGAQIYHKGAKLFLGYYETKELAHAAYCQKAAELRGEYARG